MRSRATPPARGARRRLPTPGDVLLFLLLAAAVPLSHRVTAATAPSARLVLRSEGSGSRIVDARRDADYELAGPLGTTRLRVRGGQAWILDSPCPGQFCRRMGRISGPGRPLVCVPNRVWVEFAGRDAGVDGVTR